MGVITNPIPRTEITFAERCAIERLTRCTFTPGSAHKRFARDMASMLDVAPVLATSGITDGQRDQLWRLVYRYRRQIVADGNIKDARLDYLTNNTYTISHSPGWQTKAKELINIAEAINDRMGLRRRVAILRAEAREREEVRADIR